VRKERQRSFAFRPEQPLRREQLPEPLEPGEQLADPDRTDLVSGQHERTPVDEEVGLGVDDHPGAVDHRGARRLVDPARALDAYGDVGHRIAEGEVRRPAPPAEPGDLALHPHPAEPRDPAADQLHDLAYRDRRFG
jgi:hypothetical protein